MNLQNPQILTVSKLTKKIKTLLEEKYPIVWILGEISNLRIPASGHAYCVLKDEKAQISAVMFKGQLSQLNFKLKDGMALVGMGRISIYEPRGTYQIILEYAEPQGYGALQLAFEQLKQKLTQEGLFAAGAKKSLPLLPRRLVLITSPTGAVVHDLLNIIHARFPTMAVEILPVRVQGAGAEIEIVHALAFANTRNTSDVVILARGGGSLEDLAAFNEESVARAIFASDIPVVSAIGHETDYTIADFVADVRAPTPSAAAQLVVPLKNDLLSQVSDYRFRLFRILQQKVGHHRQDLNHLRHSLVHPRKKMEDMRLRIDDLSQRLFRAAATRVHRYRTQLSQHTYQLLGNSPNRQIVSLKSRTAQLDHHLDQALKAHIGSIRDRCDHLNAMLGVLNPKAILQKGYSITRTLPHQAIVSDSDSVVQGQALEILLSKGRLQVTINKRYSPAED